MSYYVIDSKSGLLLSVQKTLTKARWYAFGLVYDKHSAKIKITTPTGISVGSVYFNQKKRDGMALGPTYRNAKGKLYLLDYDGTIFDYKTEKIVGFQRRN